MISMSERNLAVQANLLKLASSRSTGVLQLAKELEVGPERLIALLKAMSDAGLVEVREFHSGRAGRPSKRVQVTLLGQDYLSVYDTLTRTMMKSRKSDLQRASADARYAERLASRQLSPYALFLELNEISQIAGRSPL